MTIIAGIPSWVQMYFEKIVLKEGKTISQVFPDLSLYVYGGVSYEPYRQIFDKLFGKRIDTLATFPASEGFFGYQDQFNKDQTDLLLLLNNDIFYEFIKAEDFLRGIVSGGTLFSELGFYYIGPIDGHDVDYLVKILDNVKNSNHNGPILIHAVTEKGKGYKPA